LRELLATVLLAGYALGAQAQWSGFPFSGSTNSDLSAVWTAYDPVSQLYWAVAERARVIGVESNADYFRVGREPDRLGVPVTFYLDSIETNVVYTNQQGIVTNYWTTNWFLATQAVPVCYRLNIPTNDTWHQYERVKVWYDNGFYYTTQVDVVSVGKSGSGEGSFVNADFIQHLRFMLWSNPISESANARPLAGNFLNSDVLRLGNKADYAEYLNTPYVYTNTWISWSGMPPVPTTNTLVSTNYPPWPLWDLGNMVYYQQNILSNSSFGHIVNPRYVEPIHMLLPEGFSNAAPYDFAGFSDQFPYSCPLAQLTRTGDGWSNINLSTRFTGPATNRETPVFIVRSGGSLPSLSVTVSGNLLVQTNELIIGTSKTYSITATGVTQVADQWASVTNLTATPASGIVANTSILLAYTNEFSGVSITRNWGVNGRVIDELKSSIEPLTESKSFHTEWYDFQGTFRACSLKAPPYIMGGPEYAELVNAYNQGNHPDYAYFDHQTNATGEAIEYCIPTNEIVEVPIAIRLSHPGQFVIACADTLEPPDGRMWLIHAAISCKLKATHTPYTNLAGVFPFDYDKPRNVEFYYATPQSNSTDIVWTKLETLGGLTNMWSSSLKSVGTNALDEGYTNAPAYPDWSQYIYVIGKTNVGAAVYQWDFRFD